MPEELISTASATIAIIVHYGDPALTSAAVASIADDNPSPGTIVVVDNGPARLDATAFRDRVLVERPGRNIGFAAAVNLAVARHAGPATRMIWLLNNDAVAAPGAFQALLVEMEREHDRALVSSTILDSTTGEVWFLRARFYPWRLETRHESKQERARDASGNFHRSATSVPYLPGCSLLIPMSLYATVGGLDESFFLYGEDVDLSIKASDRGYVLRLCGKSVVHHRESSGSPMNARQRRQADVLLRLTARYYPWMVPSALIGGTIYGLRRAWEHRESWWVSARWNGYGDALARLIRKVVRPVSRRPDR